MTSASTQHYYADVMLLEKQPEATHYSNTRMRGATRPRFRRRARHHRALHTPPYYAIPLYPGGPKTKGVLRANARRAVLDWDDTPIPRLYAAGEMCSVFQCVYQGGDNLAECIVFRRITGQNAAAEVPMETASNPH